VAPQITRGEIHYNQCRNRHAPNRVPPLARWSEQRDRTDADYHQCTAEGERWFAAELKRRKGQLFLQRGHSEAAEEFYCQAISIAREQEAKLWELRAPASLARGPP
jgi:hypothetical protein